jgi:hypothetical protein
MNPLPFHTNNFDFVLYYYYVNQNLKCNFVIALRELHACSLKKFPYEKDVFLKTFDGSCFLNL